MKSILSSLFPLALVGALVASCASTSYELKGERGPDLQSASTEEVKETARGLMISMELGSRDKEVLSARLDGFLAKQGIQELAEERGITAVAVFTAGEGGFLYKSAEGIGQATFFGGGEAIPFKVEGHKVGAVIGGGTSHGIALTFGLVDQRRFAGEYSASGLKATIGGKGVTSGIANYDEKPEHELRYFSTGSGASADAGIGSFSIRFRD